MTAARAIRFSLALAAVMVALHVPELAWSQQAAETAPQQQIIALPRGVAVVAADAAAQRLAWDLASQLYRDPLLRPSSVDDTTARVLVGEAPDVGASGQTRDLSQIRLSLAASDPRARRLLPAVAAELDVSAVVVVYTTVHKQTRAQVFIAAKNDFAPEVLWPQPDAAGKPSWSSAVRWLRAHAEAGRSKREASTSSVVASGWFWGALALAAGVVFVAFATSSDEPAEQLQLRGRVVP